MTAENDGMTAEEDGVTAEEETAAPFRRSRRDGGDASDTTFSTRTRTSLRHEDGGDCLFFAQIRSRTAHRSAIAHFSAVI
jgi:hypothetical protein